MKFRNIRTSYLAGCVLFILMLASALFAQSSDQNFPSPIISNELTGSIRARDIGDSRSTTYFYAFDGEQGDIFINVVTKNFEGAIDVFTVAGLNPLTKMVIYSDSSLSETGRLVYLRKPERLLLRIEGRSPNDDPASFKIKFAGSFVAVSPGNDKAMVAPPSISSGSEETGIRVNSVGTIIEVIKKPQPVKALESKETVAVKEPTKIDSGIGIKTKSPTKEAVQPKVELSKNSAKTETKKATNPLKDLKVETAKAATDKKPREVKQTVSKSSDDRPTEKKTEAKVAAEKAKDKPVRPVEPPVMPDPMASIRLVIELKDGTTTWRPMSEVLKFGVDRGILTVITKDGHITRYQIFDVAKVTMQ